MQLEFVVGQHEKDQVVFRFDKFWGNLSVTVDGRPAVRDLRMFSVKLTKTYRIMVGDPEVHEVRIERTAPSFLQVAALSLCGPTSTTSSPRKVSPKAFS